jgi:NADPH:quinone reductase-like Zn-dependent oxidoreductase
LIPPPGNHLYLCFILCCSPRALGAGKIITTAGSGASEYCKGVGADEVYDYHTTNWWEDSVIADNTVDVVYDCVGQSGTADRAMKKLRTGGSFVTIAGGVSSHPKPGVKQNHFINSVTNLDNVKQLVSGRFQAPLPVRTHTVYVFVAYLTGGVHGNAHDRTPSLC